MPQPRDASAAELAGMLDDVHRFPHRTGALSMLDEAALAFAVEYPELDEAHQEFARARERHTQALPGPEQDTAWTAAVTAAQGLARVLRPLGAARIDRADRVDQADEADSRET